MEGGAREVRATGWGTHDQGGEGRQIREGGQRRED